MQIHTVKKGQTTFEYVIFVAAVIVVLIVFLSPVGPFRISVENIMNQTVDSMLNNMVNAINYQ